MFYDSNEVQLSTKCAEVTNENTAMKYRAWGWNVMEINGNDANEIRDALNSAQKEQSRPTIIIGHTTMAKGALMADGTSYEGSVKTHGAPLGDGAYINTVKALGGDVENPFVIFDDVKKMYDERRADLKKIVAERRAIEDEWAKENPQKAALKEQWFSGKAPVIDWSKVVQDRGKATRAASAACLSQLAQQVPNMVCASADLSNSDKTDGFLKQTHDITNNDFSGAFFQAGVSELTMTCMCIGMNLHGGVIPACATFFVFSDYMKPAVRTAALMEVPVKFVWTHDAFRVGEDGPTHQPVEHEAQIRLMEKLKNLHGNDSVRVLRPADAEETTVCWAIAMENMHTPTAMILSRQGIESLPEGNDYNMARHGAYVVAGSDKDYDVILVASGSEVSTLVAAAAILRKEGLKVRIVSAPSEGLFRCQSVEYQESVLPANAKIFGLTAGLPVVLEGLVGRFGTVFGMNHFGASAPYNVLNEKFGFTPENIAGKIKEYLKK
jgi:transketolase